MLAADSGLKEPMPDCFISYSIQDHKFATLLQRELRLLGISAFVASASLQPGERWSEGIMTKLQASNWVLVLCSGAACTSAFVNQEVGGALATSKHLVPIVWDINPSELPGWLSQFQVRTCETPHCPI